MPHACIDMEIVCATEVYFSSFGLVGKFLDNLFSSLPFKNLCLYLKKQMAFSILPDDLQIINVLEKSPI